MIGVVGRKAGMTRGFTEQGVSVPVTVIEVQTNRVSQLKTVESDGYQAVQLTTGSRKASKVNKAAAGHFAKAEIEAGEGLWEFRLDDHGGDVPEVGAEIDAANLVAYSVKVNGARVWGRQSNAQSWQAAVIPLDLSTGDVARVAFCTEALNNHQWTWAVWGNPELIGEL